MNGLGITIRLDTQISPESIQEKPENPKKSREHLPKSLRVGKKLKFDIL